MSNLAQIARVIGLVVCVLAILFYSGSVIGSLLLLRAGSDQPSNMLGRLLAALAVDLIFIILAVRFWRGLRHHQ